MKVTEKDVSNVADLANLELSADERARLLRDLNSILEYIDQLNELDTSNAQPVAQAIDQSSQPGSTEKDGAFFYATRDDFLEGLRKSLPHDSALQNAPDSDGTFFRVPKVIER